MLKRIRDLLGRGRNRKRAENDDQPKTGASTHTDESLERPAVRQGPRVVHHPIPASYLDPDAVKIVRRLTRFDHGAYLVGGCVRDLLLERRPKDFDVGTSATPRQIKRLFRNSRIIGRRFRLAHIYFQNGKIIEVATFRALDGPDLADDDADKLDKEDLLIREDNIFGTPEEDALRRDFTINSLFYDLSDETVLDHADGLGDLRRKLVRTIGDPEIRFREDPIRCLRAIKFAARLDFTIERETLAALRSTREEINKAATPRVLEELNRFCHGGAARASFELMRETGVLDVVLPEIARHAEGQPDSWDLTLDLLRRMDEVRHKERREIRTGEILALLLLPLLEPHFGWKDDEKVEPQRGLDAREIIDAELRPLSVRLRVPRREQEHCRQILTTLFRMVPSQRIHRNTKRAILRRECLVDALWILDVVKKRRDGDYAAAFEFWTGAKRRDTGGDTTTRAADAKPEEAQAPGRSRRRRRRPGRGRSGRGAARPETESTPGKQDSAKGPASDSTGGGREMPPAWDDDYFFAALPSAPDSGADHGETDRYGASALARRTEGEAKQSEGEAKQTSPAPESAADAEPEAKPKRRRRPRRRRRKPGQARTTQSDEQKSESESDGTGED